MMKTFWIRFWKETEGQDLVEYALIVAAIALAMVAAVRGVVTALNSLYESIAAGLAFTSS
ncbi:MAG: Flp family type IVb pilin [Acidobacteria bacterium]|nr:MAG: Flp family type IVb pilin [Acidobacteriota bacterium]